MMDSLLQNLALIRMIVSGKRNIVWTTDDKHPSHDIISAEKVKQG